MSDMNRMFHGGSWFGTAGFCRSAYRDWIYPSDRYFSLGFRVVKETKPDIRVGRGGGWNNTAGGCRSAYRFRSLPSYRLSNVGFRVVKGETNE